MIALLLAAGLSPVFAQPVPRPSDASWQAGAAADLQSALKIGVEAARRTGAGAPALAFPSGSPLAVVAVREVVPGVFHLRFPTQYLLASTFLRFQEFYESPKFRGQVFTLEQFMDWYATTTKKGRFSYYEDWSGFNIPSSVLTRFYAGDFDPLSEKEKSLLALFAGRINFYLIGTYGPDGDPTTLRHEIAHGLYSTNAEYHARVSELLKTADLRPVYRMLEKLGYNQSVWDDEAHAYLGDPQKDLRGEGVDPLPYTRLRAKLLALYAQYAVPVAR